MGAPPDFVFEGDTFAVPSWEFRCELPPVIPSGYEPAPPHTTTALFGVTWEVYRSYKFGPDGVMLMAPHGDRFHLRVDGTGGKLSDVGAVRGPEAVRFKSPLTRLSPDEFMRALKEIAERVAD